MTGEFVKFAENTHRKLNIAVASKFAELAEGHGIDGCEAIEIANNYPRVDILSPEQGVGGHNIWIDPNFLTQIRPMLTVIRSRGTSMTR